MTLRPTWSKTRSAHSALGSGVCGLLTAVLLAACSDLDPKLGALRSAQQVPDADGVDDASGEGGTGGGNPGDGRFARDIRPLMNRPGKGDPTGRGCKGCHYKSEANHTGLDLSGLDMTTLGALRQGGGSSGKRIVVAGKPAESVLVQVLRGQYPYANRMPKNGNPFWSEEEIGLVEQWISEGAKGADDE